MSQTLLVVTTLPDQAGAESLAKTLVEARLVACVNILAPCLSVFRWKGAVAQGQEVPMLMKTTADRYPALEAALREKHPYDLPEIIALPVTQGYAAYLGWVASETEESSCVIC